MSTPHPNLPGTAAPPFAGQVHVVDDDPSMRRAVGSALSGEGWDIVTHESVEAFLQAWPLRGSAPAVVLLDMRLPGMSGLDLSRRLSMAGDATPIIFISGESAPQEIIDALKSGAHEFLLKPFRLEALLAAVEGAFSRQRAAGVRATRLALLKDGWERLTPREREVCVLMLRGMANREIARLHGSVPGTVKVHRARVLEKMGVPTLSALFELAGEEDLQAWLDDGRGTA